MPEVDVEDLPAAYTQSIIVYDEMENEANEQGVYTGKLTELVSDLGLKPGVYTKVTTTLVEMGCVSQVRRGGGYQPSVWQLHYPPNLEIFNTRERPVTKGGRISKGDRSENQMYSALNTRLLAVEIGLSNLQKRLDKMMVDDA